MAVQVCSNQTYELGCHSYIFSCPPPLNISLSYLFSILLQTCSTSRVGYDTVTDYVFAVFGFRARTSISRAAWQSEIDTFRDLFGLSVRADDVLVESSPWINLYNNTGMITLHPIHEISATTTTTTVGFDINYI